MLCKRCNNGEAEEGKNLCLECDVEINSSDSFRRKIRGEWRGGGFRKIGETLSPKPLEEKPEK